MSTITSLGASDSGATSRTTINTNFTNLNTDKAEGADLTAHTAATTNAHGITGSFIGSTDTQTLTNKTLVTPTIASFTNAGHNHTNAAGGGQLTDAALSSAVTVAKGGTGQTTLTNNGILLGQGTSAVATIAAGTATYVLTANGTASAPSFQANSGVSSFKNGVTTYDLSTASGTQTIAHGLSSTPKYVRITGVTNGAGGDANYKTVGVYNGTTNSVIFILHTSTTSFVTNNGSNGVWYDATGGDSATQKGVITVDGTNITITWTKAGSPTGTLHMLWEAWA